MKSCAKSKTCCCRAQVSGIGYERYRKNSESEATRVGGRYGKKYGSGMITNTLISGVLTLVCIEMVGAEAAIHTLSLYLKITL